MSVEVWHWRLDEPPETVAALLRLLDAEEANRAERFRIDDARRRFIVGRARLRELLGRASGGPPETVAFRYGAAGKPQLAAGGPHFNLAHSGDLAVCAVSDDPVGVDVECVRPMRNREALARRWFHPRECERIEASDEPLKAFFRVWTAKEAALKLVGVGVGESLPRVLTPASPDGWAEPLPPNPQALARCWVQPIDAGAGFLATLATATDRPAATPLAWTG